MGAGIAQLAATHGCVVHLIDVNGDVLAHSIASITKRLDRSVEKRRIDQGERGAILERIKPDDAIRGLADVELAIEAVVEDIAVKRKVFGALEETVPPSAVLATNTSSLSITEIAEGVKSRARVIGMHFFNPAPIMPLVEIIAGQASDESCIDAAFQTARAWGKTAVLVKDTPGFIVNRVARGFYLESLRMLGEGVAGVDEIDVVLRTHGGFRMGPFELMDLVGLDVNFAVSTSVWQQLGKPTRLEPHGIQASLVERGHLGRKSGRGFYDYGHDAPIAAQGVDRRSFELSPLLSDAMLVFATRAGAIEAGATEQYILCRVLGAIINEAALAYAEQVASPADIDIAMVKGTNYPKGPLAWADDIGHRTVRGLLKGLNSAVGDGRYEPAALFLE